MRIALITPRFTPELVGGVAVYTFHHAMALRELGHDVTIFAWDDPDERKTSEINGIKVYRFRIHRSLFFLRRLGNKVFSIINKILARNLRVQSTWFFNNIFGAISGWIVFSRNTDSSNSFDVIEASEWGAPAAFIFPFSKNAVKIIKCHASAYSHVRNYKPYIFFSPIDVALSNYLEKIEIFNSDIVTSPSISLAKELKDSLGFDNTVEIIPNGIFLPFFDNVLPAVPNSDSPQQIRIFFSGRLDELKGIHFLLSVIPEVVNRAMVNITFEITGNGEIKDLVRIAEMHNVQNSVFFLGHVDYETNISHLKKADICVIPSHTENFPYTCLEAMAASKAIVAFDVGGLPEMITDKLEGILVSKGDREALKEALLHLIEHPKERVRLGAAARERLVREFSATTIVEKWLILYEKVNKNKTPKELNAKKP